MPLCGFNPEILKGMTLMAKGFYTSALRLYKEKGVPMEEAMEIEVQEMTIFLTALDEQYAELRKTHSIDEAMKVLEEGGIPLSGGPVEFGSGNRSIFVRDPDQTVIELRERR